MLRFLRRRSVRLALAVVAIPILLIGAYGFYLADTAGRLPWQTDPTRIPITPFADIPGFSAPALATETPIPIETPSLAPATSTGETVSQRVAGETAPTIAGTAARAG